MEALRETRHAYADVKQSVSKNTVANWTFQSLSLKKNDWIVHEAMFVLSESSLKTHNSNMNGSDGNNKVG